jgi:hypothetical protein
MAKIPDISKLTGKIDLQGIVKNVKSIISPGSEIPQTVSENSLTYKLLEIAKGLKTLVDLHTKQADELARIDGLVGSLYHDIDALDKSTAVGGESVNENKEKEVAQKVESTPEPSKEKAKEPESK